MLESGRVSQAGTDTAVDATARSAPDIQVVGETYRTVGDYTSPKPVVRARNVDVFYGDNHALQSVSLDVGKNEVISLIGPSGCGKSTFIRCLNRMNDTIDIARVHGEILLDGEDIHARAMDVVMLRARVGMVFQKPNPFEIRLRICYGISWTARKSRGGDRCVPMLEERAVAEATQGHA